MKHVILVAALCMFAGAGTLMANEGEEHANAPTTAPTTQASEPINQFCAVEGEGHAVDKAVTYVYQDKVIGFCCADCIDPFKKDPEKYMKDLK